MISNTIVLFLTSSLFNEGQFASAYDKPDFWKTEKFINSTPEEQAKAILDKMNFTQKYSMTRGRSSLLPFVGHTMAIPEVGIPQINLADGPQGFRIDYEVDGKDLKGTSTQFPSGQTVSASWDEEVIYKWGEVMGKEFYDKGAQVQLGPGLNVARLPQGGRNFEYLSGEDPYLGYVLSKQAIWGIQNQSVMANAKHWANNNQEFNRTLTNANVDERTRFEMYYPPFEGAIEAGVGSFMCSYNKINSEYSCENNSTLNTDLRERLGFKGYVMSDWGATHSVSMPQGLDQEQDGYEPNLVFKEDEVKKFEGPVLDDSVYRQLLAHIKMGTLNGTSVLSPNGTIGKNVTSPEHKQIARELAEQGIVLLSNKKNALPLNFNKTKNILIIGENDMTMNPTTSGGGSGHVDASFIESPVNELAKRLGVEKFVSKDHEVQRHCDKTETTCLIYAGGDCHDVSCIPFEWDFDASIVFLGQSTGEGSDRDDGLIQYDDDMTELINGLSRLGKHYDHKTIVVNSAPGDTILTTWAQNVDAQLINFYGGEQMAAAVFNVIEGLTNPSGKLPITLSNKLNEQNFTESQYPGIDNTANYTEKMLFGYRWYDYHKVEPLYPFGHGLSYTTFSYDGDNIRVEGRNVSINVTNTGDVSGKEVVQLYLEFPKECDEPPQILKGFKKVNLAPGTTTTVTFTLRDRDLSTWDVDTHAWALCKGEYGVNVGSSSRDIRANTQLTVDSEQSQQDKIVIIQ